MFANVFTRAKQAQKRGAALRASVSLLSSVSTFVFGKRLSSQQIGTCTYQTISRPQVFGTLVKV